MPKTYLAEFLLGQTSDTDDVDGRVDVRQDCQPPTHAAVADALRSFVGKIEQRPPSYSAVKIAGRRAYEMARKGKQCDLAPRPVEVHAIELIEFTFPHVRLRIDCGSGTYIRSIARDLGDKLGVGGIMAALERAAIGPFRLETAVGLDDLAPENWRSYSLPVVAALGSMTHVKASSAEQRAFLLGQPFAWKPAGRAVDRDEVAVLSAEDARFLGIGRYESKLRSIRPVKGGFTG
jgi:tRNA pseudouridine55 synthase